MAKVLDRQTAASIVLVSLNPAHPDRDIPMRNGGHILLVGNAGYTGAYSRDAAYQRTQRDEVTGQPILEPAYTIFGRPGRGSNTPRRR